MILVIDVGNSNTVLGLYDDGSRVTHWRIHSNQSATADEYRLSFRTLFSYAGIDTQGIRQVLIGSVVPALTTTLAEAVSGLLPASPEVLGPGTALPIAVATENPAEVGADLIANAVAAYERSRGPCIVVDFGTALTFTAVDGGGRLLGASIAPGLRTAAQALALGTAQLPDIAVSPPERAIGHDTPSALRSGLGIGFRGLVRELVGQMDRELGGGSRVYATGGLSDALTPEIPEIHQLDPWLTLDGLRLIAEHNAP
jgi:type III pantothenate kinase